MLRMFVQSDVKYERLNDVFFGMNTYNKVVGSKDLQKVLAEAEGVEYVGDDRIVSKFNGDIIKISNISTGVKTLLNILAYPDKVFYISECGGDVLDRIYCLDNAQIYSDYVIVHSRLFKPQEIIYRGRSFLCNTLDDARRCYEIYEDDLEEDLL